MTIKYTSVLFNRLCFARSQCMIAMVAWAMIASHVAIASEPDSQVDEVSVIKRALPTYPRFAIKQRLDGAVLVNFSIEQDGNVSDIEVVASDHDGLFDAPAILGVQKWVYTKPAHKIKNNYVSIEFVVNDQPVLSKFTNVEIIQVRGN